MQKQKCWSQVMTSITTAKQAELGWTVHAGMSVVRNSGAATGRTGVCSHVTI